MKSFAKLNACGKYVHILTNDPLMFDILVEVDQII